MSDVTSHYGTIEVNSLSPAQRAAQSSATRKVDWTEDGLTITRLRMLSDPGFPFWDISYCYGTIGKETVEVLLPFSQLPKYGMKAELFKEAKATGKFIKGLFTALSTLN